MLCASRAAGGDHGDGNGFAHGGEHFEIKALLDAVGVDAVEHDLARAEGDAALHPFDEVEAGILAPALGEHAEAAVRALGVHGKDDALVAILPCGIADE